MSIFSDMIDKYLEVFMDEFSVYGSSFDECLNHLQEVLSQCKENNLKLSWEKSHFMVRSGLVLGHKVSSEGIEVDKAKIEVIESLPHPIDIKGIKSFLIHASFYRRFIKDFSKITRPLCHLLCNDLTFEFGEACLNTFNSVKKSLISAPIVVALDWSLPFEITCDASNKAFGAVLG